MTVHRCSSTLLLLCRSDSGFLIPIFNNGQRERELEMGRLSDVELQVLPQVIGVAPFMPQDIALNRISVMELRISSQHWV